MEPAVASPAAAVAEPAHPRSRPWVRGVLRAGVPFLLVAGIIALRTPTALLRAEFWAEDATEFFFDAVSLGARGLAVPVYGYHFLVEHFIGWAATSLPVFYAPYVYAWSALVIDAAALAYLARDGFSWIAPKRWQRILLALLLAIGPGTAEVMLNLSNLPNPLALLAFLLLVERPFRMPWPKLLAFAVIAASAGHVLVWFPVAAYLAWVNRSRGYAAAAAVIVAMASLNATGARAASSSAGILDLDAITEVPRILIENAFARLLPFPFAGGELAGAFQLAPAAIYWTVLAITLAGFAWLAAREAALDRDGTRVLLLGYAGSIGALGLVAIGRSYNVPLLVRDSGTLLPHVRYSFLPAALATFIWSSWILRPRAARPAMAALRHAPAIILALHVAAGFQAHYARPDRAWSQRSERVQWLLDYHRETGRQVVITLTDLPVHPVRWVPDNGRTAVVLPGN
jgi:hypothetical protein